MKVVAVTLPGQSQIFGANPAPKDEQIEASFDRAKARCAPLVDGDIAATGLHNIDVATKPAAQRNARVGDNVNRFKFQISSL